MYIDILKSKIPDYFHMTKSSKLKHTCHDIMNLKICTFIPCYFPSWKCVTPTKAGEKRHAVSPGRGVMGTRGTVVVSSCVLIYPGDRNMYILVDTGRMMRPNNDFRQLVQQFCMSLFLQDMVISSKLKYNHYKVFCFANF